VYEDERVCAAALVPALRTNLFPPLFPPKKWEKKFAREHGGDIERRIPSGEGARKKCLVFGVSREKR
jgi:hypothetical protein